MAKLQREWMYCSLARQSVTALLEEGLVCVTRAAQLSRQLTERRRVAAATSSVEAGRVDNEAMALACDCAMLYQDATLAGDRGSDDFLKLSARAMSMEVQSELFIRVNVTWLMDQSRRLSWESRPASERC